MEFSGWDVSGVANMNRLFTYSDNFNRNLSGWDVLSVTDMSYMLSNTDNFNGNFRVGMFRVLLI